MESPDLPWAKSNDSRNAPKPIDSVPDQFALSFLSFLQSTGMKRGKILEIEGQNIANMNLFYSNHFEPSVMSPNDKFHLNFDQYGIRFYCYSPFSYWPFEDHYFDFVIDVHTNFSMLEKDLLQIYLENLSRTLSSDGFAALSFETKRLEEFKKILSSFDLVYKKDLGNEISIFAHRKP
ncbi:MAG: hypothetical protein ACP5N9_01785 [Candidatus Bilamarchaeum sp.]